MFIDALIGVATSRNSKKEIVRFGIMRTAGKLLAGPENSVNVIENAMKVVEMVSGNVYGTANHDNYSTIISILIWKLKIRANFMATELKQLRPKSLSVVRYLELIKGMVACDFIFRETKTAIVVVRAIFLQFDYLCEGLNLIHHYHGILTDAARGRDEGVVWLAIGRGW
ncbi:hypothetical protein SSX86_023182 [Deinandra increscens subsp. villosa]|uniref:Uncharacterized protein n=1 Tax=Deinandra increscens subsp. villosa TaxID=3103831 RepID=A0AAP0CLV5_9ASTR